MRQHEIDKTQLSVTTILADTIPHVRRTRGNVATDARCNSDKSRSGMTLWKPSPGSRKIGGQLGAGQKTLDQWQIIPAKNPYSIAKTSIRERDEESIAKTFRKWAIGTTYTQYRGVFKKSQFKKLQGTLGFSERVIFKLWWSLIMPDLVDWLKMARLTIWAEIDALSSANCHFVV